MASYILPFIIILIIAVVGVVIYTSWQLMHPPRRTVDQTPIEYGLVYEDISFQSSYDGTTLQGWWLPAQQDGKQTAAVGTVIFAHGYGMNRLQKPLYVLNLVKQLAAAGYNSLLFDFRNSGESDGKLTSVGQFEKKDLLDAICFAKEEKNTSEIALLGWSMGAVCAILAAAEALAVKKVIADSPFADLTDYLQLCLSVWSGLPKFPFNWLIIQVISLIYRINAKKVNPYRTVSQLAGRPLLLIHSKSDLTIPYTQSELLYAAADQKSASLWLTNGAAHIESYLLDPSAYTEKIITFLNRAADNNK